MSDKELQACAQRAAEAIHHDRVAGRQTVESMAVVIAQHFAGAEPVNHGLMGTLRQFAAELRHLAGCPPIAMPGIKVDVIAEKLEAIAAAEVQPPSMERVVNEANWLREQLHRVQAELDKMRATSSTPSETVTHDHERLARIRADLAALTTYHDRPLVDDMNYLLDLVNAAQGGKAE